MNSTIPRRPRALDGVHMLTPHAVPDFLDSAHEWRRLFAEAWGTFLLVVGAVGGAHLNPTVTLAFASRRNFPWRRVPGYVGAQCVGGVAAAAFLRAMFGTVALLGATVPAAGTSELQALIMEVLLTTGLVSTILGTASGARNIGANGALAVGGYVARAGLWAAPISGASMNPVRFEWILKGPATAGGPAAAQGDSLHDERSPDGGAAGAHSPLSPDKRA